MTDFACRIRVNRTEYIGTTLREHLGIRPPLTHKKTTDAA
jgi:hypothetical protein